MSRRKRHRPEALWKACAQRKGAQLVWCVQRDVKPSNILVSALPEFCVADWGLACPINQHGRVGHDDHRKVRSTGEPACAFRM